MGASTAHSHSGFEHCQLSSKGSSVSNRGKKARRKVKRRLDLLEAWVVTLLARVGELEIALHGDENATIETMFPTIEHDKDTSN